MKQIKPDMTLLSVGPNNHGLPDSHAIRLYRKHSSGADNGEQLYRTDEQGNMKLTLKRAGPWNLKTGQ
jgi:beta-lactamase superfamily II metal-dependent hydrolase